jgi:hypothetical protein
MNLGCATCPRSKACPGRTLNGLGCPQRAPGLGAVGFALTMPDLPVDLTDPKTWIIAALAGLLVYNLFFRSEQREQRASRRTAIRTARDRYRADLERIKGAA